MENFTPIASTIGGIMIGLAVAGLYFFNGRILGISNITYELLKRGDREATIECRRISTAFRSVAGPELDLCSPDYNWK